jgi:Winged helix DNA-binding domain
MTALQWSQVHAWRMSQHGLSPRDVQAALWQDRTLLKTWAMRGTLHLLSASELPLYVAARDWQHTTSWSNYFAESWGSPLKPAAYRGDLCFGQARGRRPPS